MRFWTKVFSTLLILVLSLEAGNVFAQGYNPIPPAKLGEEIDDFLGAGAVGYLVWQYSGNLGSDYFANDPYSWFQDTAPGPAICAMLQTKANQYRSSGKFIGVNMWDAGAPEHSVEKIVNHFNYLKNNCGVTVIRTFARAGANSTTSGLSADGVRKVQQAANIADVDIIYVIGDYSNGGGGMIKGGDSSPAEIKAWYESGFRGEYMNFARAVAAAVSGNSSLYGIELANEPHCNGDPSIASAYNSWIRFVSSELRNRYSIPQVGVGQMASQAGGFCDHPNHNFVTSNSAPGITMTSGHYYDQAEKEQVLRALEVSTKPFYVGEANWKDSVLIDEGQHLCKSFCRGTPTDPCAFTRGNDCSYPIDMAKFVSADVTDEEIRLASEYLADYLPNTILGKGIKYEYKGKVVDAQFCTRAGTDSDGAPTTGAGEIINQAWCSGLDGSGGVSLGTDTIRDNTHNPLEEGSDSDWRYNHLRSTLSHVCAQNKEMVGPTTKGTTLNSWILKASRIIELKESCWQEGDVPITRSRTVAGLKHPVRCMNYQDWGSLGNERDLFQGGALSACKNVHTAADRNTALNLCKQQLNQLYQDNKELYDRVSCSSDVHVATYPIFGGIDVYAPEAEDPLHENEAAVDSDEAIIFSEIDQQTPLLDMIDNPRTLYYVRPVVAGIDAFEAVEQIRQSFLTHNRLYQDDGTSPETNFLTLFFQNLIAQLRGQLEALIQSLADIARFNEDGKPFSYKRIPDSFRSDPDNPDSKNDPRFYQIQLNFNKKFDECVSYAGDPTLDRSLNNRTFTQTGSGAEGVLEFVVRFGANLINTIATLLNLNQNLEDHTVLNFIICETHPIFYRYTDESARDVLSSLFTRRQQQEIELDEAAFITTNISNWGGSGSTVANEPPNPPGCGNNANPFNANEFDTDTMSGLIACPMPALTNLWGGLQFRGPELPRDQWPTGYCGYGQPPCPMPRHEQSLVQLGIGSENDPDTIMSEGGVLNKLPYFTNQALSTQNRNYFGLKYDEDSIDYFRYCNLQGGDGRCVLDRPVSGPQGPTNQNLTCGSQLLFENACGGGQPCYEYIIDQAISRQTCAGTVINPYIAIAIALNENGGLVSANSSGTANDHFGCGRGSSGTVEEKLTCMLNTLANTCRVGETQAMKRYGYCCYYKDSVCQGIYQQQNYCAPNPNYGNNNMCTELPDTLCKSTNYGISPLNVLISNTGSGSPTVYIDSSTAQSYATVLKNYLATSQAKRLWNNYYLGFLEAYRENNCN